MPDVDLPVTVGRSSPVPSSEQTPGMAERSNRILDALIDVLTWMETPESRPS